MERALYDPRDGYYTRGHGIGATGDFITASDHGPWLARCLVRHAADAASRLDPGSPVRWIEHAAGRGLLARDVLEALPRLEPALAGRVAYHAADRSPAMRRAIAASAPGAVAADPADVPRGGQGVAVAVELFDALPARRLRRRPDGVLREIGVGLGRGGELVEVELDPDAGLVELAEARGAAAVAGTEAEIHPALESTLQRILGGLERGAAWIVDYGDDEQGLYGGSRPRGTLLAYHRHTTNQRYLERVGEQDLTAHVNFTALGEAARRAGWSVAALTTLDRFLLTGGILDDLDELAPADDPSPDAVARRMHGVQLVKPSMGRAFRVLALSRGIATDPPLLAAAAPRAPGRR